MSLVLMTLDDRQVLVEPDSPMEAKCLELGYQPEALPSIEDAKAALAAADAAEKRAQALAAAAAATSAQGNGNASPRRPNRR